MRNNHSQVLAVVLLSLLMSSLAFVAVYAMPSDAKPSSSHSRPTESGKPGAFVTGTIGDGFAVQPPPGTEPLTTLTANNSAAVLAIAHRLAMTSDNASKTQAKLGTPCLPGLKKYILPPKEAKFTIIKECVTVTGTVVWVHYFNNDGDANFNVVLDLPYKNMLGPGSYSKVFASKYPGGPAMHMETVCQGPVTGKSNENVGACDGYNGPDFRTVLPKLGQHVMVTGRYLIDRPEMLGGITEFHPVYAIKILP